MLSEQVLYFIFLWIGPVFLMVLLDYDTPRFNKLTIYIPLFLMCLLPITGPLYFANPMRRLLVFYGYMFMLVTFVMSYFYGNNLIWSLSVGGLTCIVSSYLWEVPWLIKNAIVTGFETDWILHLAGVFFFWFLKDKIGFKQEKTIKIMIATFLAFSTWHMFYTGIGPKMYESVIWNGNDFMFIRAVSIFVVFHSLKLPIHQMNTSEDKK